MCMCLMYTESKHAVIGKANNVEVLILIYSISADLRTQYLQMCKRHTCSAS